MTEPLLEQSVSYRAIVADPPWPFKWSGGPGGRRRNATPLRYELMTVDDIAALMVPAASDCALFLWTTARMHREGHALRVLEAWGFRPVGEIVWRKPNFGAGHFPRSGHETCLIGRRGLGFYAAPKNRTWTGSGGWRRTTSPSLAWRRKRDVAHPRR